MDQEDAREEDATWSLTLFPTSFPSVRATRRDPNSTPIAAQGHAGESRDSQSALLVRTEPDRAPAFKFGGERGEGRGTHSVRYVARSGRR